MTPQGDGCECAKGSYDTEAFGSLLCYTGDWSEPADSAAFAAVSADRAQGMRCSDCPEACAVCDSGVPTSTAAEASDEGGASDEAETAKSLSEFNAERIRATYGFCSKDFRPAAFFWEPVDMLRKLALSGLLQFVDRGTAFQVFCGCVLAFGSCAAQIKVAPYAEPASNLLKALVEAQIFITFLISFILRVLPTIRSSEPVSAVAYGWVLVVTLSGLLATSVGLTAHQIWRRHRGRRYYPTGEGSGGEGGEVVLELSEGLVLERGLGSGAK